MCQVYTPLDTRGTQVRLPIADFCELYIFEFLEWLVAHFWVAYFYNSNIVRLSLASLRRAVLQRNMAYDRVFEKPLAYIFTNSSLKLGRWPNRGSRGSLFAHILITVHFNAARCNHMFVK